MTDTTNTFGFSARAMRARVQPISFLMAQGVENPDVISLAAGLVDYETLPAAKIAALVDQTLADPAAARAALQYGTTAGYEPLRHALLAHAARLDGWQPGEMNLTADDVVVTAGSQQLLFILSDVLIDPGDIVITSWPSYFVYTGTLEALGAEVRCVDMDADGMIPDSLDAVLSALADAGDLRHVKIVYVVSYHQNPTGITLAEHRRERIAEIVRKYSRGHRILLLEDAAYRELTFEGDPPASMKRFDPSNEYIAVLQTFSKPFAPGLKTGYGLLPRDLVDPVVLQKGNHDFGSANFCQHVIARAMDQGVYARHVAALCRVYAAKRDAMLDALDEHLGDLPGCTWTRPSGGLYIFMTLGETFETHAEGPLFKRAIEEGVLYVPGEYCYGPDPTRTVPRNTIRLSYGVCPIEQIPTAIAALARAIRAVGHEHQARRADRS